MSIRELQEVVERAFQATWAGSRMVQDMFLEAHQDQQLGRGEVMEEAEIVGAQHGSVLRRALNVGLRNQRCGVKAGLFCMR